MKKIAKSILVVTCVVLMLAFATIPSNATSKTKAEAIEWMLARVGEGLDYDGAYGNQCVDLIYLYYTYLGESSKGGNACDYATNSLPAGWQRIPVTNGFIPQAGDIAVWKTNYTGQCEIGTYSTSWAGHIGIIYDADSVGFLTINQNFNQQKYCTKNWFYLDGLQCVIRPNFANALTVAETTKCKYKVTIAANTYVTLYDTPTTMTPSQRCFNPKEAAFSIPSNERLLLSDGTVRFKFISDEGLTLYLPWNPATMTVSQTHNYALESTTSATCTKTGSYGYKCTCGATKSQTIPAKGHNYATTYTVDKEATCTTAGSKSYHCSRCSSTKGAVTIPVKEHSLVSLSSNTVQPTCTTTGSKKLNCMHCTYTEIETIPALGHSFSEEWIVDAAADCTTSGIKSKHCSKCSAKSSVTTIPAISHNWGEFKVTVPATAEATGVSTRSCLNKDCTVTETITVPKLPGDGHAHKFGVWTVTKKADCESDGSQKRNCESCNEAEVQTLSKLGHSFGNWSEMDEDGIISRRCEKCNKTETLRIQEKPEADSSKEVATDTESDVQPDNDENKFDGISKNDDNNNDNKTTVLIVILGIAVVCITVLALLFIFKKR